MDKKLFKRKLEPFIPNPIRIVTKRIYYYFYFWWVRIFHIKRSRLSELGRRFRFERKRPFIARLGRRSIVEDNNVWNATMGDIIVGDGCFFGIGNIIMGPVRIGQNVSTGPYVCILGPRHPVYQYDVEFKETLIGDNVWISTQAIIVSGIKIGDNAVIAAGAVVNKDVAPNTFIAGNPGRDITAMSKPFRS